MFNGNGDKPARDIEREVCRINHANIKQIAFYFHLHSNLIILAIANYSLPMSSRNHMSDQSLLLSLKDGNRKAFDQIYERHWAKTYNQAFKKLKDIVVAKDITQEVFIHLWANREKNNIENLEAYLFSAVRNNVFRHLKKDSRFIEISDLIIEARVHYPQADAAILEKEFFKAYEALINSMPAAQQTIFRMRYHEDLSTTEIAEKLDISRKTVQNQLTRAVTLLRASLISMALLLSQS